MPLVAALTLSLIAGIGCTKKAENTSQVIVRLPASSVQSKPDHFNKIAKLEAMSLNDWGLNRPSSLAETKCFAVVVEIPETTTSTLASKQCTIDSLPEKNINVAQFAGLAAAGSEIELNMAPGPDRKFHLFAFAAESLAECQLTTVGSLIRKNSLSGPLLIGSTKANIVSGINNVEIIGSFATGTVYDNCEWQTPPPLVGGSLAINSGANYTKNVSVTLNPTLPFVASEAYYTKDSSCTSGGTWEPFLAARPSYNVDSGDGVKSIYARYRDSSGSISSCLSAAIILDQTAPTLTLTPVPDVNETNVSSYAFSGTCSDDGLAISWAVGTVSGSTTCSSGIFSVSGVNLAGLADGAVTATISSTDPAGNVGTASDSLVKDVVAPSLTITQPLAATYVNAAGALSLNIQGTCSENGATVNLSAGAVPGTATCTGGTYSGTINVTSEADGALTVATQLYDAVGNYRAQAVVVQKDTVPPTATLSGIPTGIVLTSTATMTVNSGDVVNYRYAVSTGSQTDCLNIGNYSGSFGVATPITVPIATPAQHFVCVLGLDAAGNQQSVSVPTIERFTSGPVTISFTERWSTAPESIGIRSLSLLISPILSTAVTLDIEAQGTSVFGLNHNGFLNGRDSISVPANTSAHSIPVSVIGSTIATIEKRLSVSLKGSLSPGVTVGEIQTHHVWIEDSAVSPNAVAQISVGTAHSCGISNLGKLFCWGSDSSGALGDGGSNIDQPIAVPIDAINTYTQVATSNYSTCAIRSDASLFCWGENSMGQLGLGDTTARTTPMMVGNGYMKVAMFQSSTCAVKIDGTLQCWGNQTNGRLGNNMASGFATSPQVINIGGNATDVSLGWDHGCAVRVDGQVFCWGGNAQGQLGQGNTVTSLTPVAVGIGGLATQISAGQFYSCALRNDNKAFCWGEGASGKLGNGTSTSSSTPVAAQASYNFISIKAGANTTCAVDLSDNKLKCWGYGYYGLLGTGTRLVGSLTPVAVLLPGPTNHFSIQNLNICAVSLGQAFCWGSGKGGVLGIGNIDVVPFSEMTPEMNFNSLSLGRGGCGLSPIGQLQCWGANDIDSFAPTGHVGDGTTLPRNSPVYVDPNETYLSVSFGTRHSCGITTGNLLKCWGSNFDGQLGIGNTTSQYSPVNVAPAYDKVSVGTQSTCGITTSDKLFCWGDNAMGQLGQGDTVDRLTPAAVLPAFNFLAVSVGANTACAITVGNDLYCWGRNENGQVGNGTVVDSLTPTFIMSSITKVSAGADVTCVVNTASEIYCWGRNGDAEIGQGAIAPANYSSPVLVASGYMDVKVGKNKKSNGPGTHVCALNSGGALMCWGSSDFGQNTPSLTSILSPTLVESGPFTALETGELQTCARTLALGTWRCRGAATESQLPINFTSDVPQLVPRVRF